MHGRVLLRKASDDEDDPRHFAAKDA
jgi:hypothetical protein